MYKRSAPATIVLLLTFAANIAPARGAETDGSLDSMWNDQVQNNSKNQGQAVGPAFTIETGPGKNVTGAAQPSTPLPAESDFTQPGNASFSATHSSAPGASSSSSTWAPPASSSTDFRADNSSSAKSAASASETNSSASAPLCAVQTFVQGPFVQTTSWPGIGPFRGDNTDFQDANHNRLSLGTDKDKIATAELSLVNGPNGWLRLQMASDFLLEALGARQGKIADFNTQLEKSRSGITRPLNLSAGRYLVYIQPNKPGSSFDTTKFIVRVTSKDASPELKDSIASNPVVQKADDGRTLKSNLSLMGDRSQPKTAAPIYSSKAATDTASTTGTFNPDPVAQTGDLRSQFLALVNEWQRIKKTAVRQRGVDELSQVLSGKALARQTDAVKWLMTNHKYYDMAPKAAVVDRYVEQVPGQKYSVFAQVRENSKYVDENSGQIIKDTLDTYNVNYTVEKVADRWYITDSAIVPSITPAPKLTTNPSASSH